MYKLLIRPVLFLFPPESAHHLVFLFLKIMLRIPGMRFLFRKILVPENPGLAVEYMGIQFPNPVGVAAGLDKDGRYIHELAALGFGFIEVGTVTPLPQPGNPKPRLFRLKKDRALINRMGFNNAGADKLAKHLVHRPRGIVIGVNIGKNKQTPNETAEKDYVACFEKLYGLADYFVVNVSSPNTPGLRELQTKEGLDRILGALQQANRAKPKLSPILLKIAPDLEDGQVRQMVETAIQHGLAGIVATNTTTGRKGLKTKPEKVNKFGAGGLSGTRELHQRSLQILRIIREKAGNRLTLIGVGGIHHPEQALEKLQAGANLVQVYTGLIYEGPVLAKKICRHLRLNA